MRTIKNFWNIKIKKPIGDLIDKVDNKVDPSFGKKAYKISRRISLFFFLVVFPVLTLVIGINAYEYVQGSEPFLSDLAVKLIIGFLWLFMILAYVSWFYFSKWNDVTKEMKELIKEEKAQMKINKKLAKTEDLKKLEAASNKEEKNIEEEQENEG